MASFLLLLWPGAYAAGPDLQDCFLRWLVSPRGRRLMGVTHPASGRRDVYLSLHIGLGPRPGYNGHCVKELHLQGS